MSEPNDDAPQYEACLGAIGSWLEAQNAFRFRVLEMPDGFEVTHDQSGRQTFQRKFTFDELDGFRAERRRFGAPKAVSNGLLRAGRKDFMQALGRELDNAQAHAILLDSLDDAILVTYSYLDVLKGYSWRKRMNLLDTESVEQLLERERSRQRESRGKFGFMR